MATPAGRPALGDLDDEADQPLVALPPPRPAASSLEGHLSRLAKLLQDLLDRLHAHSGAERAKRFEIEIQRRGQDPLQVLTPFCGSMDTER